jgi:Protein of unknown function (DUF2630)
MMHGMSDETTVKRIETLVEEEHALLHNEQRDLVSPDQLDADRQRLDQISVELDRCWDLLRQRRALREAGQNPDDAQARGASTVENYLQ